MNHKWINTVSTNSGLVKFIFWGIGGACNTSY